MKKLRMNANDSIWIKLTEEGIKHIVEYTNNIMPVKLQTCYSQIEERKNEYGYWEFQLWSFINQFGDVSMKQSEYYNITDVLFNPSDLKEVKLFALKGSNPG